MTMDLADSIIPKSDQLNAEDLLTGARTVTIAEVRAGNTEQPVHVHLVEFPGRPFKPSKTVRRLMVQAWGKDSAAYTGRRMTLYRDPTVKFGGMDVGGIRVSHMSHINERFTLALTVTRGKRAAYVVEPLIEAAPVAPTPPKLTPARRGRLFALLTEKGIADADQLAYLSNGLGRQLAHRDEMNEDEYARVVDHLETLPSAEGGEGS